MLDDKLEELSVAEVLGRWPQAALVLLRQGVACVGCDNACCEAPGDAAFSYHLDWDSLL